MRENSHLITQRVPCILTYLGVNCFLGVVTDLSSFHAHNTLRTTHWDSLEKALTVFVLPSTDSGGPRRLRRRVDFIFAQPETYWTAIIGWCVFLYLYVSRTV